LKLVARGGDSVVLEPPKLKVSSSVLWDSVSISYKTVLGEEFSLFVSEFICFSTEEEVLPLRVLPSSFLLNHFELGWWVSAISEWLDRLTLTLEEVTFYLHAFSFTMKLTSCSCRIRPSFTFP
jgi:hypothetical protein